ncbi:hypothetical protein HNQ77_001165 [Silvibacterium bohemicum]|uniref:Uncharacterized protein n=1 Tax=Silvibacterium bohemicum TaxID=1577686 RepID=A0A841JW72_9BACT|nr:hypothetical protein [Silvibacterium bohemicum]MBB6143221.1 hypothetical protein [Silvibacterium bohemicum]
MRTWKLFAVPVLAAAFFSNTSPAPAQISVNIGVAPVCPYGYYDFAPYNCAPYGYYGPEWFTGGVFIGAGPWFHGHHDFYGHVDNHFDPNHGYHGAFPNRGEHADAHLMQHHAENFHGGDFRDGRGHEGRPR